MPSRETYVTNLDLANQETAATLQNFNLTGKAKLYTTKYLTDLLLVLDHRKNTSSSMSLPKAFVELNIERAKNVIGEDKLKLFNFIIEDLHLEKNDPIDLITYNYTGLRLMALAALPVEDLEKILENKEAFLKDLGNINFSNFGNGKAFIRNLDVAISSRLEDVITLEEVDDSYAYGVLVCLGIQELENIQTTAFPNFIIPLNDSVLILDKYPFMGTQTIVLSMLNGVNLIAAPLTNNIGAHKQSRYDAAFGITSHDLDHDLIWKGEKAKLDLLNVEPIYLNFLLDIYRIAVNNPSAENKKKVLDIQFVLMHEDSKIAEEAKKFIENNPGKQPTYEEMLTHLKECKIPSSKSFEDLGLIVATNAGYEKTTKQNYGSSLGKLRQEVIDIIAERLNILN